MNAANETPQASRQPLPTQVPPVSAPLRRQLSLSLLFNFIAKAPGILSVFVVIPMISNALGEADYGLFLASLSLGALFAIPYGGVLAVSRRLLATAYVASDQEEQASVFATTSRIVTALTIIALVCIMLLQRSSGLVWVVVACIPALGTFLNMFDNVRASYNEHYVTAKLQTVFQLLIFGAVILFGLPKGAILLSALVLTMPYALSSLGTFTLLLRQRPYLLCGRAQHFNAIITPAVGIILADGSLTAVLHSSVYVLSHHFSPEYSAWLGTYIRLFTSFMSPILLILIPLTSFASAQWGTAAKEKKRKIFHWIFVLSMAYGALVAAAIWFGGPLYVKTMFTLTARGDAFSLLSISIFFGSYIAQQAYSMLAYSLASGRITSYGSALVTCLGLLAGAIAYCFLPLNRCVDVTFLTIGVLLPFLLIYGNHSGRVLD